MIKYLFLILIFCVTTLSASILEKKIENLIGEKEYRIHQNLIGLLFKKESRYLIDEKINYYNLFCKAAADDLLYKVQRNNFCMFNYYYNQIESVLMIFAIPINPSEEVEIKQVAERVMKIVRELENCFITLEYLNANEVSEDKFIYIIAVKKIEGKVED